TLACDALARFMRLDGRDAFHATLFWSKRLLLVAPPDPKSGPRPERVIGRHIVVGWKPGEAVKRAARAALPGLDAAMAQGDFAPLLSWLRTNIHEKGRLLRPRDLVAAATGQAPTAGPLIRHLNAKAQAIYGF
ncbi:MAG TPA: hypothetical protein PKD41_06765, partial [Solidesulfovibrio sp.]|nr:hypothetical protein [Solidesulfovibrio sp.]